METWCNADATAVDRFDFMMQLGVKNITANVERKYPGMEAYIPEKPNKLLGDQCVVDSEEWQGRQTAMDAGKEGAFDKFVAFWNAELLKLEKGLGHCLYRYKRAHTDAGLLVDKAKAAKKTVAEYIDLVGEEVEKKKKPPKTPKEKLPDAKSLKRKLEKSDQDLEQYKKKSQQLKDQVKAQEETLKSRAEQLAALKDQDLTGTVSTLEGEKGELTRVNGRLNVEVTDLTSLVSKLQSHITMLISILQSQQSYNGKIPPTPTMADCTTEREERK
jgi:predicted  nucleic acid-binding Zn-ribbon protein